MRRWASTECHRLLGCARDQTRTSEVGIREKRREGSKDEVAKRVDKQQVPLFRESDRDQ
jgi:hypothetical protein